MTIQGRCSNCGSALPFAPCAKCAPSPQPESAAQKVPSATQLALLRAIDEGRYGRLIKAEDWYAEVSKARAMLSAAPTNEEQR